MINWTCLACIFKGVMVSFKSCNYVRSWKKKKENSSNLVLYLFYLLKDFGLITLIFKLYLIALGDIIKYLVSFYHMFIPFQTQWNAVIFKT